MTEEAFEGFYRRNCRSVYRICFSYMKNPQDAEDCTEDTFLRALTHQVEFENPRHEAGWLTVTAMNVCRDRLKHWWHKNVVPLEDYEEAAAEEPPEDGDVLEAVMALPVKYKDVVLLYYYQGYSTDEIAAMLRRPGSTVRNQLRDARKKLEQLLGGEAL